MLLHFNMIFVSFSASIVNRHVLQHHHSFRHPHNDQRYMTLDSRHRSRRRSRPQSSRNVYHGSYGHLLEDEDLLQQCLVSFYLGLWSLKAQLGFIHV